MVARALDDAGARERMLDCPGGAGRLTPLLLDRADSVTVADISPAMVQQAREALVPAVAAGRVAFAVGSAAALPFADDAFDTVVCHRLLHHVQDAGERHAIFSELGRVARRRVVLSFGDADSVKARLQRAKGRRSSHAALTHAALRAETEAAGLRSVGTIARLNGLFSILAVAVFAAPGARD